MWASSDECLILLRKSIGNFFEYAIGGSEAGFNQWMIGFFSNLNVASKINASNLRELMPT